MAADETLLRSAVDGRASLRFYGWSEVTLSLGYFQPEAVRREFPRLAELPCVRRPTGGATLVHHHEVTYCLALPANVAGPRASPWLSRVHGIIVEALHPFGINASLHEGAEARLGPVLCFLDHTPGDVLLNGSKIVGSAQRRRHGALLQHGAILLAQSPFTSDLPGLRELAGIDLAPTDCVASVLITLARETKWQLQDEQWSADEGRVTEALVKTKYATTEWTNKR
jgi:lipoate-protein ligase A